MSWQDRGVLIVGAGIAGLALAAGLRRQGVDCQLVERAPEWAPVGAGIVLAVNAMQVMRELEVADAFDGRSAVLGEMAITDAAGRVLGRSDLAELRPRFGITRAVHRAVLHDVLLSAAGDTSIRMDCTVDVLEEREDGIAVRLSDGTSGEYGLVVGADGLRSRVRELAFGPVPLRYAGYTCWRLVVEAPPSLERSQEMWGRGKRFGLVRLDDRRAYCFAVANAPADEPDPEDGRVDRFRRRFSDFAGPVPEVLAQVERPEQLIHNDLEEVVHRPWARGRVWLVGDAAHGMTPNMGQGAAMALEDVAVLWRLAGEKLALDETQHRWAERREPRVRWVQDQSRRIGRIGHWQNPLACRLRNALVRAVPDSASTRALRRMASQPI